MLPSAGPSAGQPSARRFDLAIVGGGLAGASLAAALSTSPLSIALVESAPPPVRPEGWDARIYAVSPANAAFLGKIGAWEHLAHARIAPIAAMRVFGDLGGELGFSAFETGVSELGWILESSLIACELWEGIKRQANLTRFCPASPEALEIRPEAATLTLTGGERLSARLVVGADGRDSWVRAQTGLKAVTTCYGEKGVVANFTTEQPHRGIAWQWFREDGVLAYLPLPGERISIVWSTPDEHADALCALSPAALAERVAQAGGHVLGRLTTITPATAFPLRLIRVPEIVQHRLALVGDAGHGIHPLSGHGVNLGFQDARILAELLLKTPAWQDIGAERFLMRYARARKEEILLMQRTTDALRRLFRAGTLAFPLLRNAGLALANRVSPLKNLLARYALGAL
ncbi:MAG: UbiH/UbiF family hydroxylase [Zoogloeaceae bacterium]|jgi:ubiquinone biosynthesis UbiH/UbiF/VisC/COQ6 family hydroxylase|nr:UbiH/UbiF family hydroxylase [Zoogloeaceae bacterium]